jgi:hypothetical protein
MPRLCQDLGGLGVGPVVDHTALSHGPSTGERNQHDANAKHHELAVSLGHAQNLAGFLDDA